MSLKAWMGFWRSFFHLNVLAQDRAGCRGLTQPGQAIPCVRAGSEVASGGGCKVDLVLFETAPLQAV